MTVIASILRRCSGALLAVAIAVAVSPSHSASADEKDYGPDWQVCRARPPSTPMKQAEACTRLIEGGKLTIEHLSWVYNDRGVAWQELGDYARAMADFNQALSAQARPNPYTNRGFLYLKAGRLNDALADFEAALNLAPDNRDARYGRSQAFYELKRYPEAVKDLSFMLDSGDTRLTTRIQRGDSYLHMREYDKAKIDLDMAVLMAPRSADAWCFHGDLQTRMLAYDAAIADLSIALKLDPRHYCALSSRAYANTMLGRPKEAIQDLVFAASIRPSSIDTMEALARAYLADGQYDSALAECRLILERQAVDSQCQDIVLRSLLLAGKLEETEKNATELMSTANAPGFVVYRGASRYARGDYDGAAKDFAQFSNMAPEDPYAILWSYLTSKRRGVEDTQRVIEAANLHDTWPNPLFKFIKGDISAEDVLASVDVPDERLKRQRLGEANFYLGELAAISGDLAGSRAYYQGAVDAGQVDNYGEELLIPYKIDNDLEIAIAKIALVGSPL